MSGWWPSRSVTASTQPANASASVRSPNAKATRDRKSTRLNSGHTVISYAVFCLKKKKMIWSGLVILAFVVFHLMHYTFGLVVATAPNGTNFLDLHESLKHTTPNDPTQRQHLDAM